MNASGTWLNGTTASSFYVNPVRLNTGISSNALVYDTANNEIVYNTNKTFVINHPTDDDRYLVHACLEGPEAGVYYRGEGKIENNESVDVHLPHYVSSLATDLTVQITPIFDGKIKTFNVGRVKDNKFTVYGENGEFYWTVYGKRQSIDTEPLKSNAEVKGHGPYKWL